MIKHLDYGDPCPCGIDTVTPAQEFLISKFDNWYGDKSYRAHHEVASWATELMMVLGQDD
jgi:hypothetical protein